MTKQNKQTRKPKPKSIEINGKTYLTQKGAAERYGFSIHWFELRRAKKIDPSYIRFNGNRIYYNKEETDKWFLANLEPCP